MAELRRRELIAAGAAGALAVGTPTAEAKKRSRTFDVVVVGAGLAGLSAGRRIRIAG